MLCFRTMKQQAALLKVKDDNMMFGSVKLPNKPSEEIKYKIKQSIIEKISPEQVSKGSWIEILYLISI